MKKKERRVFFEFDGFDEIEIGKSNHGAQVQKLLSRNFDKLLNLLISKMILNGINHQNGYVDISSTALRETVGKYKLYIKFLIDKGYLERSYFVFKTKGKLCPEYLYKNYRKSKPFGYRFTELFKQNIKIKRIIYIPNSDEYHGTTKPKHNKRKIEFNIKPALIKRLKRDFKSCQINNDIVEKTNFRRSKFIDIGKWFYNHSELFKWKRGDKSFTTSSGRLYTNFTRLSSHVRLGNITMNKEELMCKDISNSFPLMLAIYTIKTSPDLLYNEDFKEYCSWVISGTFYDNLTAGLNAIRNADEKQRLKVKQSKPNRKALISDENLNSKRILPKDIVKILFQIYLNGNKNKTPHVDGYGNSLITDFMKMKFGIIHEQLVSLKDNNCCIYDKLVMEESQFIFQVVENLYNKYESIQLLTVHDSIYTTKSDFPRLDEEWNQQFKKLIDILPTDEQYENNEDSEDDFDNWIVINENGGNIIEIDNIDNYDSISNIGKGFNRRFNDDFWGDGLSLG